MMNKINEIFWRVRRLVPVAVWLLVVAAAAWLYRDIGGTADAPGVAQILEYRLSTTEVGRVASLEVVAGQRVAPGQVIARLDTEIIEREMAVAQARLRQLESQVGATGVSLELESLQHGRGFEWQTDAAEIDLPAARASEARDRAELAQVEAEIRRLRDLVRRRLVKIDGVEALEVRRAALQESVQSWPARIAVLETHLKQSAERQYAWDRAHSAPSQASARDVQLKPVQLRIAEQQETLRLLAARLNRAVLRAPVESLVVTILARPGNVLRPGDPVVSMVETSPRLVVAYLEERQGASVARGAKALARRRGATREPIEGRVESVTGAVTEFPARFRINPALPRFGREVVVQIPPGVSLDPGEAVDITFTGESAGNKTFLSMSRTNEGGQR